MAAGPVQLWLFAVLPANWFSFFRLCPSFVGQFRESFCRRTADGLSKPEFIRCLKRYLAREVFRSLQAD
jgi:hypothetical protein